MLVRLVIISLVSLFGFSVQAQSVQDDLLDKIYKPPQAEKIGRRQDRSLFKEEGGAVIDIEQTPNGIDRSPNSNGMALPNQKVPIQDEQRRCPVLS